MPVTWGFVPRLQSLSHHSDVYLSLFFLNSFAFFHLEYNLKILNMQRGGNALTRNLVWFMLQMRLTTAKQTALQEIETTSSNQSQRMKE